MALVGVSLTYTNILQWGYNEAQGPLEVNPSAILDLAGSNQYLSCPMAMSFF